MPRSAEQMVGRWILSAPNAPSCGMNFAARSSIAEGLIEPEGGCPGRLFMSRRWQLADGQLLISDRENAPLAQLQFADGSFQGQATDGSPLTLMRSSF
jgi:hypothetical protein